MKQFAVKPEIFMCDTCKEFCDEYKIGKGDLILSNEYIFEPYFSQYVSGATVVYVEKYGTGEPSDEMVEAIDAYKDKFESVAIAEPMLGEVGEVIDIIKKNGDQKAVEDAEVRQHLVEEMADVLMYYNDVLLCYGISEQELKEAYTAKFKKNMTRW